MPPSLWPLAAVPPQALLPRLLATQSETNALKFSSVKRPEQALISDPAGITFTRLVFTKQEHDN
jgi:hypothetical protein